MPRVKPGNNEPEIGGGDNEMAVAAGKLRSFVERINRLEDDKKAVSDDIKEVYAEAKGIGLDVKTIRSLIRWNRKDKAKREAEAALLDLYSGALGWTGVFG